MKRKKYEAPKFSSEFSFAEPVETGCCLRSCGGSPYHMGVKKINPVIEKKIKNAIKKTNEIC